MGSKAESNLGDLLRSEFPHYRVIPQHPVKISRRTLFLDYYIPQLKLAFEVDGRQHAAYVAHFHRDRMGFEDSKYRDSLKDRWCLEHGVRLIRFSHQEKITKERLREKLIG